MVAPVNIEDDDSRLNAATAWYSRLNGDAQPESVWEAFTAWLEADDANRAAYDRVEALYADLDELSPDLALTGGTKPAPTAEVITLSAWRLRRPVLRFGLGAVAALAASLALFAIVRVTLLNDEVTHYATKMGEARTVALADGTTIDMNTASGLTVAFNGRERRVTLDHGEALFRVGKDSARPFVVTVGGREVRDIGTVFNILRDDKRTVVTVESGKVLVAASGSGAPEVQLVAGEQLAARDGEGQVVTHVDPAQATSWRDGYLTYKEAPLSVVVADLNRYFPDRIVLADRDTSVRRFSGVLKVDDEEAVLNRLTQLLPLVIDRRADGKVGLRLKRQGD
jgi:transmembrane sensor